VKWTDLYSSTTGKRENDARKIAAETGPGPNARKKTAPLHFMTASRILGQQRHQFPPRWGRKQWPKGRQNFYNGIGKRHEHPAFVR